MATINIGNLSFTHKGDYAGGTAYVKNDIVYYATNGNSYIAKGSTTGNVPTSTAHWDLFVAGSGGIWNAGLSLGSANQEIRVNSGGTALEFHTPSSGGILQVKSTIKTDTQSITSNFPNFADISGLSVDITPSSASNKILIEVNLNVDCSTGYRNGAKIIRTVSGSSAVHIGNATSFSNRTGVTFGCGIGSPNGLHAHSFRMLDNPNTTNAVNYKIAVGTESTGGNIVINRDLNDGDNNSHVRGSSTITAMEVASGVL